MSDRLRVAYTLEQLWHPVPGGTAVAALKLAEAIVDRGDVELIGVAGRHRRQPAPEYRSPIDIRRLPFGRPYLYETWNRTGRPRVERATGPVDVCHSTLAVPAGTKAPHVVTVHDIAFMHTPDRFTRHGSRVMEAGLERCRSATLITCPSDVTRRDLIDIGFDGGRTRVVPWGVEVPTVTAADIQRVRTEYALPDDFILFVGTVEPRKNLTRLAHAVERSDSGLPLVIAGATGWGEQAALSGRFVGFLPAADLAAVYSAATVFAYPSLQEGFGLPVAEAMAHGVPVVTSCGTSAEEVAGGAAQLVDPTNVASIAEGIDLAFDRRAELRAAGLARAATMTWAACAAAMSTVYHEAAVSR